jgi:ribonuclease HI
MGETLAYAPRKAIKSQILADSVAEWTDTHLAPPQIQAECWTLYFDGSVMKTGAGAGLLFISPLGEHMRYAVRLHFPVSNNMAEYEAFLCGLRISIETGIKCLDVRGDSQLVIDQVMKNASCHDDKMEAYCNAVRALEDKFYGIELNHVPRLYNEEADELAKIAPGRITVPQMFLRGMSLNRPSTSSRPPRARRNPRGLHRTQQTQSLWTRTPRTKRLYSHCSRGMARARPKPWTQIQSPARRTGETDTSPGWIEGNPPPPNRSEARRVARMAKSFTLADDELYKCAVSGVLQRCVPIPQGRELLRDIHAGVCGHHAAPRTLVGNAFRQGFY